MLLKQKEVARALGVSTPTVRRYEEKGLLNRINRPGAWYTAKEVYLLLGKNPQTVQNERQKND